jgi:hypothetical protein
MSVPYFTIHIKDNQGRHASEFQELDLLAVGAGDDMFGVRDTGERHAFPVPPIGKRLGVFRSYGDDLGLTTDEFRVILAQLRHVPATVRSAKTPVEHQDDVLFTPVVRQIYDPVVAIPHTEVQAGRSQLFGHYGHTPFLNYASNFAAGQHATRLRQKLVGFIEAKLLFQSDIAQLAFIESGIG